MKAKEFVTKMREQKFVFSVAHEGLYVTPRRLLTERMVRYIKNHKQEIIDFLSNNEDVSKEYAPVFEYYLTDDNAVRIMIAPRTSLIEAKEHLSKKFGDRFRCVRYKPASG